MNRRIPRRDFLNGVAIGVTGAVAGRLFAAPAFAQSRSYPPALTGLRGNYPDAVAAFAAIEHGGYRQFGVVPFDNDARETYDRLVVDVKRLIVEHDRVTVGLVRDAFGTSRKYALAILEHLDERKVTRRIGDERVLA